MEVGGPTLKVAIIIMGLHRGLMKRGKQAECQLSSPCPSLLWTKCDELLQAPEALITLALWNCELK